MLKAGALFYAIVVSLIVGVLSSSLIFFSYFNYIEIHMAAGVEQAQLNAMSGLNLLLGQPEQVPYDKDVTVDLFDAGDDEVELRRGHWGAFEVGVASAFVKRNIISRAVLIGSNLHDDSKVSLILADRGKPLSLCGKTVINGTCYLPKAGVKRAYIEGQSFMGSRLINGETRMSDKQIPGINETMISHNRAYLSGIFGTNDSVVSFSRLGGEDSVTVDFSGKTLLVQSKDGIVLTGQYYGGNIRIVSENSVFIGSACHLENVIIYAPFVQLEDGFTGNVQVFASDSVKVGEKCRLKYPSVIGLIRNDDGDNAFLQIGKESEISGVAFAYREKTDAKKMMKLIIDEQALIRGQVYCNDMVDLKGDIYGSLACTKFILSTPSSVYENHLLNVTIDYSRLSPHFVGVNLVNQTENRNVVKWLY